MALKFSNCHISDSDGPGVHPIFHPTTFQAFYLDCKKQPKHRKYSEIQKSRSKWGTLILQMKISQVFFTPSAAEHQRAGFSLEYSVWGKFCLSPAPGQSRQQSRIGGSAAQDGIRNPLIQDCSFCSVLWDQIWSQRCTLKGSWRWQFHISHQIFAFSGQIIMKPSGAPEFQDWPQKSSCTGFGSKI